MSARCCPDGPNGLPLGFQIAIVSTSRQRSGKEMYQEDANQSNTRVFMLLGGNRIDVLQQLAPPELWHASLDWQRHMYVIGANGESALGANDNGLGAARNV